MIRTAAVSSSATTSSPTGSSLRGQYHHSTEPLIDYYDDQGILRRAPASLYADDIRAAFETLRLEGN